jgi:hypothetical protein
VTLSDCARVPSRVSDDGRGRSVSSSQRPLLPRPSIRLGRPAALRSSAQLRRGGAVAAREACRVVEHCDGDCSHESGYGEHKSDYDRAAPVASAAPVGPVSVAFLVQRSIPLRPPGALRLLRRFAWWARSGSKRGAASWLGLRNRLCSSRSKSAIRWGIVLGTSDRAASSRATAA